MGGARVLIDEPLLRAAGFGPGARAIPLKGGQGRSWQVRSPEGEPLVLKLKLPTGGSRSAAEFVAAERTALELAASAGPARAATSSKRQLR